MTKHERCKAITKTGKQCKHPALWGDYCTVHYVINQREKQKKNAKQKS